jgi:hypothetical protein
MHSHSTSCTHLHALAWGKTHRYGAAPTAHTHALAWGNTHRYGAAPTVHTHGRSHLTREAGTNQQLRHTF